MRVVAIALKIYALLCALALILIPVSAHGWFGVEKDPLAAVFAIGLGMPLTLLLSRLGDVGPLFGACLIAICMALNITIVWLLARRFLN